MEKCVSSCSTLFAFCVDETTRLCLARWPWSLLLHAVWSCLLGGVAVAVWGLAWVAARQ